MTPVKKKTILVVDDEADVVLGLVKILSHAGYETLAVADGLEALTKAREIQPDLILLDLMLPGLSGTAVKIRLAEDESTAGIPVIFLSAKDSPQDKVAGLELEADDYMTKPFQSEELLARIGVAIRRQQRYKKISTTDTLTGLPNFGAFQAELETLLDVAKRYHRTFALAVVDLDNLKEINDTLGHQAGDAAIQCVAKSIPQTLRKVDLLFRYGGDEFVILFPECTAQQAAVAVRRFKEKIAETKLPLQSAPERLRVSVSTGIADYTSKLHSGSGLFHLADQRMYLEKLEKKGQVFRKTGQKIPILIQ